jgi:cytochrome c
MDSFELNKIIGAVLGTLLFVMGVGFVAEAIYVPIEGNGPGYELPEPGGTENPGTGTEQPVQVADIGTLLAAANPEEGAGQARKCQSCHNFQEGGPNGQGPNLYGIVGRPVASHEGFQYSDAMKAHAAEVGGNWTYEALNAFLTAPKSVVPGTKMNFGGVKGDQERANIIAFLSTLSASPVPFPAPKPAGGEAAPAGEAPAADAAPAAEAPAATTEPAPAATPTTTQGETPVEGTATGSNTPAGAETPAAGGTTTVAPAEQPAPAATITPAPAPTGSVTTPAPASSTTTTTTSP